MGSITKKSLQIVAESNFSLISQQIVAKAMATADEMESYPLPTYISQLGEVKQDPTVNLSLEDIAWADSCLEDPDASQIDWNSWDAFSLALSETLSYETDSLPAMIDDHPEGAVIEISPSIQQIGSANILGTKADHVSSVTEAADDNSQDQLVNELTDISHSEINLKNVFLPAWNETLANSPASNTEEAVDFPGFVMEQSTEDIFKVWDLGLPAEEDEFVNQLNKAFAQTSVSDDSVSKSLKDIAIEDIISGISDLSLNYFPI